MDEMEEEGGLRRQEDGGRRRKMEKDGEGWRRIEEGLHTVCYTIETREELLYDRIAYSPFHCTYSIVFCMYITLVVINRYEVITKCKSML